MRNTYKILVGKREGRKQPDRTGRKWEDNIEMDVNDIGCNDMG